ncbi:RNA 2',3'-cyclic phosphodiesterase [Paucibacter sp. KBW04]|uniref:2'-5' RNA ligase family protein n=1 Tax=Paucibacter sp. KBW04 TaxID=2153361 RepID=UPI000F571067|nr:2'-5' RNA ligase family protein [Paucibacter sp. KBW04]RQO53610.1 RNA 2',3'-cyclic phosphodiesterase [Paucibacter sp. KBW04]
MPTQLNLPGFAPEAPRAMPPVVKPQGTQGFKHKLFFAIFPAAEEAERIHLRAEGLRQQHRLTEGLIEAERLHITLHMLGNYADLIPDEHIETAVQVAARVQAQSFEVELDHALSLQRNGAFVLSDTKRESPFTNFRCDLVRALIQHGFSNHPRGTPHMTLLYSRHHRVAEEAIRPIRFLVQHFSLIHSHTGKHRYEELGRWNLSPDSRP